MRPATEDDLEQVLQMEKDSNIYVHWSKHQPWSHEGFLAELSKPYSHFLVVTDDETDTEVIAYLILHLIGDSASILSILVSYSYRGLGWAKKMLEKALELSRREGAKQVSLEVRKSNQAAIQLYQMKKFNILRVLKDFYSDGEDAYHMVLEFSE